jgi:hypothetical protein
MNSSITPPEPNTGGVSSFNKVERSISGHQFETDDTVGNERIKRSHAKGTFEEWDATGGRTLVVNGENFTAVVGNESIVISGTCNVTVTGDCNLNVGAHLFAEAQTMYFQARQSINFKAGSSINMESVAGDFTVNSGGGYRLTVEGEANERFKSKLDTNIVGDNDLTIGQNFNTQVGSIATQHAEAGTNITSGTNTMLAGGNKLILGGGEGEGVDVHSGGIIDVKSKSSTTITSEDSLSVNSTASTVFESADFTIASGPVDIAEALTTDSTITGGTGVELTAHIHTGDDGGNTGAPKTA